ncbi:hypothetical protein SAMN06297387_11365 [Streptomyces zhaozhouensis]|uniref:Uncharacterized protein n=1 Tax=Streptomyces zhaozhouensis TaxID=1300267 RepID=A0A286DZ16_9ACTN|nr:hypothetical protein [Streptomyces zhaozhouensis]SOD63906.1 hypothetical protein SAMN06297387_11365 [Streptomyces zhaozhouensis]
MRLTWKGDDRPEKPAPGSASEPAPPPEGDPATPAARATPEGAERPAPPDGVPEKPDAGERTSDRGETPTAGLVKAPEPPAARPAFDPLAPEPERLATAPLFTAEAADALRAELGEAVAGFVDDPARSVTRADAALEEAVARLTEELAHRRRALRDGWQSEEAPTGPTTEDRRTALRDYRDLVDRLLRC